MLRGTHSMRRPLPEQTLVTLLSQCYTAPRCLGAAPRRNISALHSRRPPAELLSSRLVKPLAVRGWSSGNPNDKPTSIAVLGGGITGLTAAYDLSRSHPSIPITLYESSNVVGGWVESHYVPVDKGTVVFEGGPRTLRPHTVNGMLTLQLAKTLGLEDKILITPKSSAAAKNRYIYYPDHLVKMPGPGQDLYEILWSLMTEKVFKGLLKGMIFEHGREGPIPRDESIGDFLYRRLGTTNVADNIVSAALHGIYAGDIYQLSAESLMGALRAQESIYGSMSMAALERLSVARQHKIGPPMFMQRHEAGLRSNLARNLGTVARWEEMQKASVYSFEGGIQTFTDALEEQFRDAPGKNATIKTDTVITKMVPDKKTGGVQLTTRTWQDDEAGLSPESEPKTYSHVVSTLPANKLHNILTSTVKSTSTPSHDGFSALGAIPTATVMVINLYYPSTYLPIEGFGYLIPRSLPFSQNPEFALGVVFDSDATTLDMNHDGKRENIGTKLTVIMGGHYWSHLSEGEYPTETEGLEMAKRVVARHLKIEDEPEAANVTLQRDCIPQYTVGHESRLKKIDEALSHVFDGRVAVAGAWTGGVGVNDCVQAGRKAAITVGDGGGTGLEWVRGEKKWVWADVSGKVVAEAKER